MQSLKKKIYSAINNPNQLGLNCDYIAEQQYIGGGVSLAGLPNQLNNLVPHIVLL